MNSKGHPFFQQNDLQPLIVFRDQPRPIDLRMRLLLLRPSIKGLPSLMHDSGTDKPWVWGVRRECVVIGTQFSNLYTAVDTPDRRHTHNPV